MGKAMHTGDGDGRATRWLVALLSVLVMSLFGWGTFQQTTDARHDTALREHGERIKATETDNEWFKTNISELKELMKEALDELREEKRRP